MMNRYKITALTVFLVALLLFSFGCTNADKSSTATLPIGTKAEPADSDAQQKLTSETPEAAKTVFEAIPRSTKAGKNDSGAEQVVVSGTIAGLSFEEMAETSTLIVYGEVSRICEPALVEWVGGGSSHITDVEFSVSETLRGKCGDTVTVRTLGGLIDSVNEDYTDVPELIEGKSYLLFLYQPGMGGGMNTQGDYYYLNGLSQGVYVPEKVLAREDPVLVNYEERFSSRSNSDINQKAELGLKQQENSPAQKAAFSLSSLKNWSEELNRQHPVDPDYFKKAELEAYQFNLENGTMTQEEYDQFTAQLDQYARIVS